MYLAHYILPLVIYFFYKNKEMLFGLLIGNLVDLDHLYMRIIGEVPLAGNICGLEKFWQCSGFLDILYILFI